jgi:hypothetical protein
VRNVPQRHDTLYMTARAYAGEEAVSAIHRSSPALTENLATLLRYMRPLSLC